MKKIVLMIIVLMFIMNDALSYEGTVKVSDSCGDDCTYTIYTDGHMEITGSGNMTNYGYVNCGSCVQGKKSNAPWASENVTSVSISGISSVSAYAFNSMNSLKSVEMSDSVTSIGNAVFEGAKGLENVRLSDNLTSIPYHAFYYTSALKNLTIPEKVGTIGETALGRSGLTSITIPKNVTTLGMEAFASCSSLTSIEFEEGSKLTTINPRAFYGTKDTSLVLPDTVKYIYDDAFSSSLIESIFIPEGVTTLNNAFGGNGYGSMNKLTQLYCPKNLEATCQARLETASLASSILSTYESKGGIYALTDSEGNVSYFDSLANLKGGTACENIILCKATYMAAENDVCSEISECAEMISNCPIGTHLQNLSCVDNPEGCADFANGACSACDNNYYKKENGCVSSSEGCGEGYLEKDGVCISSANGCGAGYKNMGGWCNRIQYTPAEAAEVLTDDNNNSVTITFKK